MTYLWETLRERSKKSKMYWEASYTEPRNAVISLRSSWAVLNERTASATQNTSMTAGLMVLDQNPTTGNNWLTKGLKNIYLKIEALLFLGK